MLTRLCCGLLFLWYASAAHADALLSQKMLYGKWCSDGGSEKFTAKTLTVLRAGERKAIVFKIDRYDTNDDTVTLYWTYTDGTKMVTEFSEFSPDGRRMVQIKNDAGPRREFHRC